MTLAQSAFGQFTFPVYEPFAYPEGEKLGTAGSSGVYWNFGNSVSSVSSPIVTVNAALSYPGLVADPNSPARGIIGATAAGRTRGATFTSQTAGTTYSSFLLSLQDLPGGDKPIFGLNGVNSGTPDPKSGVSVWVTALGQLKLGKNLSSATANTNTSTTPPLVLSNTYLVVLAYQFANGEADLWLDPTILGTNGSAPPPTIFTTNGANSTNLQSVCLYSGSSTPISTNLFDEIRINNSWAGVTSNSCSPGNIYNVSGGGTGCQNSSFTVGVSGSDLNVDYLLYTNGIFGGAMVSGTGSAINFTDQTNTGLYTVLASNTFSSCVGWMNSNASITVYDPPAIVTQPKPVVVVANGTCAFSVSALGIGISYQWKRDGTNLVDNGRITGSQTPNLVVEQTATTDAATAANGYAVVISNVCGISVSSVTNGLTLDTAANLTWQGDGILNAWDVATSANWTNSVGASVVFNYGDNVTFDDTATNTIVSLASSFLSPSLVTMNGTANNYTLTGSGSIIGPGSLLVTGGATITNRIANGYAGGTTLSNGVMYLATTAGLNGLGSGTVNLAGGTLYIGSGLGFSSSVGVSNNLDQTASSSLQYDGTGSEGCVLFGSLTGAAGTTFSIIHNGTGPDRLRLYGSNFTENANLSLDGTGIQWAPYNAAGSQSYNGIISGGGQLISRNGGATLLLNGSNTFGGGLVLSTGRVGLGLDSTSSSPPNIDEGPIGTGPLLLSVETVSTAASGSATLFANGDPHTLQNPINYITGTNLYTFIIGGSNTLTLSGAFDLVGNDGTFTNRIIQVDNTAPSILAGVISDNNLGVSLVKTGSGTLYLEAVNTYTGATTNMAGVLAGTGTIAGPVVVQSGATLMGGGPSALGTLAIGGALDLGGNVAVRVNTSLSPSNDLIVVGGTLTNSGSGTVTVTNLGSALTAGTKFTLFSKAVQNGAALTVTGGGVTWSNNLAMNGSISVAPSAPAQPPLITSTFRSGNNLVINGTNGSQGGTFYVLAATNPTLPRASWTPISTNVFGAGGAFSVTNSITPGIPARFFTLEVP